MDKIKAVHVPWTRYRLARSCLPAPTAWDTTTSAGLEAYEQGLYGEAEEYLSAAVKEAERFSPVPAEAGQVQDRYLQHPGVLKGDVLQARKTPTAKLKNTTLN